MRGMDWSRSTMDSIRVSEALDTGSIPVETTDKKPYYIKYQQLNKDLIKYS